MKFLLILFLFLSNVSIAKECFKDKQSGEQVCYKRYFERTKIHNAKHNEKYYTSKKGKIYAIGNKIEVKFNSLGAILSLLDDYDIEFIDKTKGEKYIFEIKNPNDLFGMLRVLNDLDAIQKAHPLKIRKYTKSHIQYLKDKRQERVKKIQNSTNKSKNAQTKKGNTQQKSSIKGGNFLEGAIK